MNQKACYAGCISTVCISRTTQSRSELSADLTGVNVEVGGEYCFVYFGKPLYESACTIIVAYIVIAGKIVF